MKQFIKSLKLLKYGLQFKTMIILTIVFFALGIIFEVTSYGGDMGILSGLYMVLAGVYIYQLMLTPSVSKLVQTSSFRRKMQTIYPMILTELTSLFSFTVFVIIRVARIEARGGRYFDEGTLVSSKGILITAVLAAILIIYDGICFKYYIASFAVMFVALIIIAFRYAAGLSTVFDFADSLSYAQLIGLSYGLLLVGGLICWLISIFAYRKPIDNLSVRTAIRQAQSK